MVSTLATTRQVPTLHSLATACYCLLLPLPLLSSAATLFSSTATLPFSIVTLSFSTATLSHTLLITCSCCCDESKGTKDQDSSYSFSDSLYCHTVLLNYPPPLPQCSSQLSRCTATLSSSATSNLPPTSATSNLPPTSATSNLLPTSANCSAHY